MRKYRRETIEVSAAAIAALALTATNSWSALIYSQDFDGFTAAAMYSAGDFDPVADASLETVQEGGANAIQVVNGSTNNDTGTPSGPPQVLGGNSLKFIAHSTTPNPAYRAWPSGIGNNGGAVSTLTLSFYGIPGSGSFDRLLEVWAAEDNGNKGFGGPDPAFVYAFRFEEDGKVLYDDLGWNDSGLTVSHNQWNHIGIAAQANGSGKAYVTLNLNGTLHTNGSTGFGAGWGSPATIDRYQIGSQLSSGVGSGFFIENIRIYDVFNSNISEPGIATRVDDIQFQQVIAVEIESKEGLIYTLEAAEDGSMPFVSTGTMQIGNGQLIVLCDPSPSSPGRIYRVCEETK